jgi:peptide/nickel transport system permease protein
MRRRGRRMVLLGGAMVVFFVAVALLAPLLVAYSPTMQQLDQSLALPSSEHPFGQDKLGRDLLSRVAYGARISLSVGLVTIAFSALMGLLLGTTAGYLRGTVDDLLMRLVDVLLAFPGLLLAIAISAVLGPSLRNVVIALCVVSWTGYARVARGEVLWLREREFVTAARALGASPARVIALHLVPHLLPLVLVQATFGMAGAVVAEAGLSFLGIGVRPPTPSWGGMINEGRPFLLIAPHLSVFPGLALMTVVLGLNLLGDGLRDFFDRRGH